MCCLIRHPKREATISPVSNPPPVRRIRLPTRHRNHLRTRPEPSAGVVGRPLRVSKGGGRRRKATSGGHGAQRPRGRAGARQVATQSIEAYRRTPKRRTKKNPATGVAGFWVKTLAMTYSRMLDAHYHRRVRVSLPSSEWNRVVPRSYVHQGEGGGSRVMPADCSGGMIALTLSEGGCSEADPNPDVIVESKAT